MGTLLAQRPFGRGAAGYRLNFSSSPKATARAVLISSFSVVGSIGRPKVASQREVARAVREGNAFQHAPLISPRNQTAQLAYALRNRYFNHYPLGKGRIAAGAGGERGVINRFYNHHLGSVRRQPRGCFCIHAPRSEQSYQHRAVSGPLGVGPPTARR